MSRWHVARAGGNRRSQREGQGGLEATNIPFEPDSREDRDVQQSSEVGFVPLMRCSIVEKSWRRDQKVDGELHDRLEKRPKKASGCHARALAASGKAKHVRR